MCHIIHSMIDEKSWEKSLKGWKAIIRLKYEYIKEDFDMCVSVQVSTFCVCVSLDAWVLHVQGAGMLSVCGHICDKCDKEIKGLST